MDEQLEYTAQEREAYQNGIDAAKQNLLASANPYYLDTQQHRAWSAGWKHEHYLQLARAV